MNSEGNPRGGGCWPVYTSGGSEGHIYLRTDAPSWHLSKELEAVTSSQGRARPAQAKAVGYNPRLARKYLCRGCDLNPGVSKNDSLAEP